MTNDQLSYILRNVDCSKGRSVRIVDNLEAILLERHKTVTSNSGCRYVEYYDYLILLKGEVKVGII